MKYGAIKYGTAYEYGKSANAAESATVSDVRVSSPSKVAAESLTVTDILEAFKTAVIVFVEYVTASDLFQTVGAFYVSILDALGIYDGSWKDTAANRVETVTAQDVATKATASEKSESSTVSDVRTVSVGKLAAESSTVSDVATKSTGKTYAEAFSVSDVFSRIITYGRSFLENLTVRDSWLAYLNGLRAGLWEKVSKTAGSWLKSAKSEGIWNSEAKDSTDEWNRTSNP